MTPVPDGVKEVRPYRSPKRAAQAAATRVEIVEAARSLFVAHGYVATTLADIASAAGVAVPTIKIAYRTKRLVLAAVWDHAVKAGPDPRPVVEQEWFQQMIAAPDPRDHLRLQVAGSRQVKERIAPIVEVIRAAAAADAEIAALWTTMQTEFHANQHRTILALQQKGQLRPGLTEDEATDLLYTLNHPTLYHMLVLGQGWPADRYEQWLTETLIDQ
ncbi:MAG TPA: helix-turn-helix domain-containing protein, partial [Pseudonocardiaceae bacterium]